MLKIAWSPQYRHSLPPGHRFPMEKYELLPEQLLWEGTVTEASFFAPQPMADAEIVLTHHPSYWYKLKGLQLSKQEERRTGFPQSMALVQRERIIAQGTVDCCYHALQHGIALNVAGGTHHAFADRGEGFCLLNDIALAAQHLLAHGLARQVLVVDLDVHQGNGTASIFAHESRVFTFSMHGAHNYPMHKEESDLDIALPDGTGDEAYLKMLAETLPRLLDRVEPDFLFYLCGVDVLASDKLGRLGMSLAGCKQRDALVLRLAQRHQLPLVCSMGGGYSPDIRTIMEAHANTFRLAAQLYA